MKIFLTGLDESLIESWKRFCGDFPEVEVYHGSILDLDVDAVVSPANSFGFMDGGIDRIYSKAFPQLQRRLMENIRDNFNGELLVGQATMVQASDTLYLIAAPTMRVPMILEESVNPYLAARAAIRLAMSENLNSIAFPGLGTGVGQVPADVCAWQMRIAIDEVVRGNIKPPHTWREAQRDHQLLYTKTVRDLQHGKQE